MSLLSSAVTLDGPLALGKEPIACPRCGTTQIKALLSPRKKGGTAQAVCAAKRAHLWETVLPGAVVTSLKTAPAGPFRLRMPAGELTGRKADGKAPATGGKAAPAAPAQHTPAVQAYAAAKGRPSGGGGGAFAAACNAVAATMNAAGAGFNAAAAGANAVGKVGGEGLGLARDAVRAADKESGRWHQRWMRRSTPGT